jgi:hypothetical protein
MHALPAVLRLRTGPDLNHDVFTIHSESEPESAWANRGLGNSP